MRIMHQSVKARGLEEGEIRDLLAMQKLASGNATKSITAFVARKTGGKWIVEFTYSIATGEKTKDLSFTDYTVISQRGGTRFFSLLTGVESWMEKMKVSEFKVVL